MKNKGTFLIIIAAVMWGCTGIFVNAMRSFGIGNMQMVSLRSLLTAFLLGIFMLFTDKSAFKIRLKDSWIFALNGIVAILLFNYCYYKTMELSTLSVAAILMYTSPFFVMAISVIFFHEKITAKKIFALICAFVGCALVSGVTGNNRISGECLLFGLFTGFGYALYTVIGNILVNKNYNSLTIIFYTFLFSFLGSIPMLFITGEGFSNAISIRAVAITFAMALLNSALPNTIYTLGLRNVELSKAPIIAMFEPVTATVIGTFYGEKITLISATGIGCVLVAVALLNIERRAKN
ncbi:MAG: DMT family transporter [Clostridia bacterium]|nr:DMT family transporter [Clostridia bacterium]